MINDEYILDVRPTKQIKYVINDLCAIDTNNIWINQIGLQKRCHLNGTLRMEENDVIIINNKYIQMFIFI